MIFPSIKCVFDGIFGFCIIRNNASRDSNSVKSCLNIIFVILLKIFFNP